MRRGHIAYPELGRPVTEHLREHESRDRCPKGSVCAQEAIKRVQDYWRQKHRIGLSLHKRAFVETTGDPG